MRRCAFTLIELLVVMMILATLAALLTGGAFKVIDSANEVQCINNMSELHDIILVYFQQHGRFPAPSPYWHEENRCWLYGSNDAGGLCVNGGDLMRDGGIGNPDLVLCPMHTKKQGLYRESQDYIYWRSSNPEHHGHKLPRLFGSYSMNQETYANNAPPTSELWDAFSQKAFLLVEEHPLESRFRHHLDWSAEISDRHAGAGHVALFGGAVIRVTPEEFDEARSGEENEVRWLPKHRWK